MRSPMLSSQTEERRRGRGAKAAELHECREGGQDELRRTRGLDGELVKRKGHLFGAPKKSINLVLYEEHFLVSLKSQIHDVPYETYCL